MNNDCRSYCTDQTICLFLMHFISLGTFKYKLCQAKKKPTNSFRFRKDITLHFMHKQIYFQSEQKRLNVVKLCKLHTYKLWKENIFSLRVGLGLCTFSLIQASSLSTFLLNSCRLLAPPRALFWLAAVCLRVCHWSRSWLSCFRTRSEVGFVLQISCSPIFWRWKDWQWARHNDSVGKRHATQDSEGAHLTPQGPTVIAYMLQSGSKMLEACHSVCGLLETPVPPLPFLGCLSVSGG